MTQNLNHLECLEVVDKDIGEPEMVDQLQVDGDHGVHAVAGGHVGQVLGEAGLKVQCWNIFQFQCFNKYFYRNEETWFPPHHIEVAAELHTVLLENIWNFIDK